MSDFRDSDIEGDQAGGFVTLRRVDEHYQRVAHFYSTRTSDAYQAIETNTKEQVLLWLLRHPIISDSDAAQRFINRFDLLSRLSGTTAPIRCYGVDSSGVAFFVTDFIEGIPLVDVKASPSVLQGLFIEALRKVSILHQRGILLGDICDHSFLLAAKSKVQLMAVLGTFEVEASQTTMLPPASTLHYVSPEQRSGVGVDLACDVYALGVLAYRMFTGRYMFGDKPPMLGADEQMKLVPAPSMLSKNAPIWADAIIGHCVEIQATNRFRDAGEILEAIERAVKTGEVPDAGNRWSQKTMVDPTVPLVIPKRGTVATRPSAENSGGPNGTKKKTKKKRERVQIVVPRRAIFGALGMVAAVVLGGVIFLHFSGPSDSQIGKDLGVNAADLPPELRPYLTDFFSTKNSPKTRKEALEKIAQSDDPLAYSVLVYATRKSPDAELRATGEAALVNRIQKEGLSRTAALIETWFKQGRNSAKDDKAGNFYNWVLRACETDLPIEARQTAIHKVYTEQPDIAVQLAGALALDDREQNGFLIVLRQLVAAHTGQAAASDKSLGALLFADPVLGEVFGSEIKDLLPGFSGDDLRWALGKLSQTDDEMFYKVAEELSKRNVLPPFQTVFLKILIDSDKTTLPSGVKHALVEGAQREVTERGIVEIAKWYSADAESVLLAMCAIAKDGDIQLMAFDTLTGKDIQTEPAHSLVEWIKKGLWDDRAKVVKAVGILGHYSIAGTEEVEYAFDQLMPYSGQTSLFRALVKSGIPKMILMALNRMGEIAPSPDLLPLLTNPDKSVRMATIKSLKERNDLIVLQGVLRAYESEKDDEVRQVYQQMHWVTRDRSSPFEGNSGDQGGGDSSSSSALPTMPIH